MDKKDLSKKGFETRCIHAAGGEASTGSVNVPIYQTAAYVFESTEQAGARFGLEDVGPIYSRITNPTVSALEKRLAAIEGGVGATCAASGLAAELLALFCLLQPGDDIVASTRLYGGSVSMFTRSFKQFGWGCHLVDITDINAVKKAITPKTKALFVETVANPGGVVADLGALSQIAKENKIVLIVDNTMTTPYLCMPFEFGADLVVHSTTKFLNGSATAMGGAVIDSGKFDWTASGKYPLLTEPEPTYHGLKFHEKFGKMAFTFFSHAIGLRDLGACQAPMNAFMTLNGIETLALRMDRHVQNALEVAKFLEKHPQVEYVNYASLPSSPYNALAQKYMPKGAGAVMSFGVKGGYNAGVQVVESVKMFRHLANIGDTRSLIIHPASTTHRQLSKEQQAAAEILPNLVRISVGLETVSDIIEDLDQAISQAVRKAA